VIATSGGEVYELVGDQAVAVFASARQAFRAAVALQQRMADERAADPSFQFGAAGTLPESLPPLETPTQLTNLSAQLTSFIGRVEERAWVRDLLADSRLVTLTGTGWAGKTRLALQVAEELLERYRDGVWMVELARHRGAHRLKSTRIEGVEARPLPHSASRQQVTPRASRSQGALWRTNRANLGAILENGEDPREVICPGRC
jgi:hypothetical protein